MQEGRMIRDCSLYRAIRRHASGRDVRVALDDGGGRAIVYGALLGELGRRIDWIQKAGLRRIGLLADNGIDWILADLAAVLGEIPIVPLPAFFTDDQLHHTIRVSGIDGILTDQPDRARGLWERSAFIGSSGELVGLRFEGVDGPSAGFEKVTFASGTTGKPKGVRVRHSGVLSVAGSLCQASAATARDRHLCLLPLSILRENVGVYGALMVGARVLVPPLCRVGVAGSSGIDERTMYEALRDTRATRALGVPQLLDRLVAFMESGTRRLRHLRSLGVGGAPVPKGLLARAAEVGIPVHEGYGLSECASVVAVNVPAATRLGSVGRPLPHLDVRVAEDGEIRVRTSAVSEGYLTADGPEACDLDEDGYLRTGDIGRIDPDGFLWVEGRRNSRIITTFGRNIAPEWIEAELRGHPLVAQAAVLGDGRPALDAVVYCEQPDVEGVRAHIAHVNASLPDYARIDRWRFAEEPFSWSNGQMTRGGEPERGEIAHTYAEAEWDSTSN